MKKVLYALVLIAFLASCKSKKEAVVSTVPLEVQEPEQEVHNVEASIDRLNTVWKLVSIEGNYVDLANFSSDIPSIMIDSNRSVFDGVDGCNMLKGTVSVDGNTIRFAGKQATKMACKKTASTARFTELLSGGELTYKIIKASLFLYKGDKEVLEFVEF
ncbi:MAG: META domain-containing protein [Bacteroidales bacterium]